MKEIIGILYKIIGPEFSSRIGLSWFGKLIFKLVKTLKSPNGIYKTRLGFKLKLDDSWAFVTGILFLGELNPNETDFYRKMVKSGDVIVDIGAHEDGWHCFCVMAFGGEKSMAYAFEPIRKYRDSLSNNIKLNKLEKRFKCYQKAIFSKSGFIRMIDEGGSSYIDKTKGEVEVEMMTLDSFIESNNINKIDILKLDIEGAEFEALKGAKEVLTRIKPRIIMIEIIDHLLKRYGSSASAVFDLLKGYGYKSYRFENNGNLVKSDFMGLDEYKCFNWVFMNNED